MSNNRDLLKEAIADAKAVKETAIANAKAALEESFTPYLKSMLAAKLEEMEKDEEVMESETIMEEEMDINITEEDLKEVDLDELLNELEIEEETTIEEEKSEEDEETEESTEETEELDLENMSEEDLKQIIEDVIDSMVRDGELEPGDSFEMKDDEDEMGVEDGEIDLEIEDDEESDLEEMMGQDADVSEYKKELEEAYGVINNLKQELQEINLLNAKLLYTNKIFKSRNLEESKKINILKSIDKAENVKEVKLVYESILEGLSIDKTKSPSIVKEIKSMASKPSGAQSSTIVESNDMVKRFQKLAGII
jgi:hypothetical protein